ncbi:MAG TPA: hypothetical protein VF629_12420, partial [Hymenobacter sp.]|uniref:hypothetical protein n=1 Tax=Hymenobacter sp. TaxID=1898978 RepID=UPI002EDB4099
MKDSSQFAERRRCDAAFRAEVLRLASKAARPKPALVKSLVQKLIGQSPSLLPVEGEEGFDVKAEGVFEGVVGEVKFAVQ